MKNTHRERSREHVSRDEVLIAGSRQDELLPNPGREQVTDEGVTANAKRQRIWRLFAVMALGI